MANQNHIEELIALWLAGEASEADLKQLEEWKTETPENAAYFSQFETIWKHSTESGMFEDKTESAWNKVQQQMNAPSAKPVKTRSIKPAVYLPIAAALAGILFLTVYLIKNDKQHQVADLPKIKGIHVTAGQKEITVNLPDQTLAILSPGATLDADSSFGISHRTVVLKGKAYFKTVHGNKLTFCVRSGELLVRDIGTAFYVTDEKGKSGVWVTQGEVQVIARKDTVSLFKGDTAEILPNLPVITHRKKELDQNNSVNLNGKVLKFEKTELSKVVETLNGIYACHISLGNKQIEHCPLTATFTNEKVDEILDLIRDVFNLEIQHSGNKIILTGKGCN